MPDYRSQYQQRRAERQVGGAVLISLVVTTALFGIGYLIIRSSLISSIYEEMLASNSRIGFDALHFTRLISYVPVFVVVWIGLAVVITLLKGAPHDSFDFGETQPSEHDAYTAHPSEYRQRPINLYKVSPRQFEEHVARLISYQTGHRAVAVGGAGDRGADVKVYDANNRLIGVVQCKRYNPKKALPPNFVREMSAVRQIHQVSIVYLATTAYFTDATRREAVGLGIRLIDGHDLKQIIKKTSAPRPARTIAESMPPPPHASFQPPTILPAPPRQIGVDFSRPLNGMWDDPPESGPTYQRASRTQPGQPIIRSAPAPLDDDPIEAARIRRQLEERRGRLGKPGEDRPRPRGKWDVGK